MNEFFATKYDQFLMEFNRYVIEHPEFLADIPNEALIVFIDPTDPAFNRFNLERVERYRAVDDKPDRPIVYLDVGELAPIHSRIQNPRILTRRPDLAMA
jgi:hypothetical protein